jgi:hypothetical protein
MLWVEPVAWWLGARVGELEFANASGCRDAEVE